MDGWIKANLQNTSQNVLVVCEDFFVRVLVRTVSAVCWQVCVTVTRYMEYHYCWHSSRNFAIGAQVGYLCYFVDWLFRISGIGQGPPTAHLPTGARSCRGKFYTDSDPCIGFHFEIAKQGCLVPVETSDKRYKF